MTIPTPTSEGLAGLAGAVPAGLPDEVTLARLAGEFFAALPSGFGKNVVQHGQRELRMPLSGVDFTREPAFAVNDGERQSFGRGFEREQFHGGRREIQPPL